MTKMNLQAVHYVLLVCAGIAAGLPSMEAAFPSAAPVMKGVGAVLVMLTAVLGAISPSAGQAKADGGSGGTGTGGGPYRTKAEIPPPPPEDTPVPPTKRDGLVRLMLDRAKAFYHEFGVVPHVVGAFLFSVLFVTVVMSASGCAFLQSKKGADTVLAVADVVCIETSALLEVPAIMQACNLTNDPAVVQMVENLMAQKKAALSVGVAYGSTMTVTHSAEVKDAGK